MTWISERSHVESLPMNWTVHPLNQDSPLFEYATEDLKKLTSKFM